jgi:hypothetical protein
MCKDNIKMDLKDSRDSSVRIVTRLQAERAEVCFPAGAGTFFLFLRASRPALEATQPPLQWLQITFSRCRTPRREGYHSPPSSAGVKYAWSYASTPPNVFMAWCMVKHRDNFTLLYLTLLHFTSLHFTSQTLKYYCIRVWAGIN